MAARRRGLGSVNELPTKITKIMSLTLADFHRSVETLVPGNATADDQTEVTVPQGDATVCISYEALESETLGGLLALPRARVTIDLGGLDESRSKVFLARFDQAFQRGGG